MNRHLYLFSSELERSAAFPDGLPHGIATGITGVGLVDSAIGTTSLLHRFRPASVVFLGTCGAHGGGGLRIGDVVVASEIVVSSGDVARGLMRLPKLLPSVVATDRGLSQAFIGRASRRWEGAARAARVSCTLGITESNSLAQVLHEFDGTDVENMEAFSVVRACEGIPVAVVLGVTNFVGEQGGRDWADNYRALMRKVAELV